MKRKSKEEVSASFHFFLRKPSSPSKDTIVPFSKIEFSQLVNAIKTRPKSNLKNANDLEALRFNGIVSLEQLKIINDRTVFGVFRAPYTGHAYENSEKGKISANSVSMRGFHYLLYHAEDGKIYLGSQYLGSYGGYGALSKTLKELFDTPKSITSHTFKLDSSYYENAQAKEVIVTFRRNPKIINSDNIFGNNSMIAVKKENRDDGFEDGVSKSLFPLIGKGSSDIKSALAELVNENVLFDVSDEDIQDCTILATINGKKKKIYMFENGSYATKFTLNVPLSSDGHPLYENTKDEMLSLLQHKILSRNQNV
ncbi:MAG: hypothetical protein OCD03_09875 [Hyphomicrobiales bacterium]